jgi:uncharacterized protein (UPF0332 family)
LPDVEVTQLLSEAEKRLDVARHLMKEGFYDDAVSRAYYSMYFSTVALFLTRNIRVKTHKGLIARVGQSLSIRVLLNGTMAEP